jgi:hypothetical protein
MRLKVPRFFHSDGFVGLVLALVSFLVYRTTVSPSLGYWDSSELAAVLSTLGVTHPTGYPLFTLVGAGVAHLPTGFRPYYNLNLMVALYCSLALFFFYRLFVFLLSEKAARLFAFRAPVANPRPSWSRWAAATGVMVLAFSRTFWSEAVSLEVYSLHLVFLSLVTLLFVKALAQQLLHPGRSAGRWWMFFALALGMSFSHHMMTVLLAPAFLYLYFTVHGFGRLAWIGIGRAALPFLAGLSFYLYLPVRAAQDAVMNWGDPDTPSRFWTHVSAAQYRFKMFASPEVPAKKAAAFLASFPAEFGYAPLALAALGFLWLCLRSRRMLAFTLLVVAACLFYAFNYDFDDPNFYLHAYAMVALWAAFGVARLSMFAGTAFRRWGLRALCGLIVLFPFDANYASVDESRNYAVEDYVRNLLEPLPPGALILSDDLQGFIPGAYYLQLVEKVRPDVVVVGHGVLAYPWYQAQLEKRYPGLLQGVRPEMRAYAEERRRVERGDTSRHRVYSALFTRLVQGILATNARKRPLYVTADIHPGFYKGFETLPEGMALRLVRGENFPKTPVGPRDFGFRPIPEHLAYAGYIRTAYAWGYYNQGRHAILNGDSSEGVARYRKALEVKPDFGPALQGLP